MKCEYCNNKNATTIHGFIKQKKSLWLCEDCNNLSHQIKQEIFVKSCEKQKLKYEVWKASLSWEKATLRAYQNSIKGL